MLAQLVEVALRPGQRGGREPRAVLRRPVHRDLRRLGGALHRRPHRLPDPARGRAQGGIAPGRGGEHDPLPPPQGHRVDARAVGPRRHRLAGPGRRVLRAAGHDPVHEPRPTTRRRRPPTCATPTGSPSGAPFQAGAFDPSAHTAEIRRIGSTPGPAPAATTSRNVGHLPLARPGPRAPLAARRSPRRTGPPSLPLRPARDRRRSSSPTRDPRRRSPTWPSRSTCRCP